MILDLQGVEPALYAPEDLMGAERRAAGQQTSSRVPYIDEETQPQPSSSSWFSHWFGLSDARSSAATDAKAAALSKPPFVRL